MHPPRGDAQDGASIFLNTNPSVEYVGSQTCGRAGCHEEISREYFATPHGQSMEPANAPSDLAWASKPVTVFSAKSGRYYTVFTKGGNLYQAEYELDRSGQKINKLEHKLDYVAGGENTGYSYLFRVGRWMFQAPLSYYAPSKTWELSPGYTVDDAGFTRLLTTGCLVCHNGQPVPVARRDGMYGNPPFRFGELGISCESCHGPGALHVRAMEQQKPRALGPKEVDLTIVNPAKLSPRLGDDICQECHQAGSAVVLRPGREYMDFRPGTPLSDTMEIVQRPIPESARAEANRLEKEPPIRGSLEEPLWWKSSTMELSKCYQASHGQLRCETCHRVHHRPAPGMEDAALRDACLSCHTVSSCRLKADDPKRVAARDSCVGCHMEKRPIAGIAHSVDTKHRIVLYPGQPLPEVAFEQPKADLPGLLWLNRPSDRAVFPDDAELEAYWTAARIDPSLWPLWFRKLNAMSKSAKEDPLVLNYLGVLALEDRKDYGTAAQDFSRALALRSEDPTTFLNLAAALRGLGQKAEAEAVLRRGVAAYPYNDGLVAGLALQYSSDGKNADATDVIRAYQRYFPEDQAVRSARHMIESNGEAPAILSDRGA
ncbi:MAG: cytochrome c3 family protein, partial [Terracidiphilus sp.]